MMRRTPLTAKTGLARKKELRRGGALEGGTGLNRGRSLERPAKPKVSPRGTGPSREMRAMVLERDGAACLRCGVSIVGRPYSLHHRKLRSQGGANDFPTLITLCGTGTTGCHGHVHAFVSESLDAGWLVSGSADPSQVPVPVASQYGSGALVWLSADGAFLTECPEVAA